MTGSRMTMAQFALAWMLTGSVFLTLLAVGITALAPRLVLRVARQRRLTRLEAQLPGTLQMIAGSMKAGVSLMQAIEQVTHESPAPMSQELTKLLEEQRLGRPLDEALAALARRVPLQSMQLATSAIRMAADVGGPLAETMERLAQSLRTKLAIESKIRSLTSQGKAQALIIGALPFFLMIALTWLEPTEMRLMFSTTAGYAVLAVIVLLELAGWLLIRKIVNIDV